MIKGPLVMVVGIALTYLYLLLPVAALVDHNKLQPSTKSFRLM